MENYKEVKMIELVENEMRLCCPNCAESYLHQRETCTIFRDMEDSDGTITKCEGTDTTIERIKSENIVGRSDSIFVEFSCENCSSYPVLLIAQHKSNTYIGWVKSIEQKGWPFCQ